MKEKVTNRARSMGELGAFLGQVFRRDEIESAIASYHPRSSDIVFSPFGYSEGTAFRRRMFSWWRRATTSAFKRSRDWKQLQMYPNRRFTRPAIGFNHGPILFPAAKASREVFGSHTQRRHPKSVRKLGIAE